MILDYKQFYEKKINARAAETFANQFTLPLPLEVMGRMFRDPYFRFFQNIAVLSFPNNGVTETQVRLDRIAAKEIVKALFDDIEIDEFQKRLYYFSSVNPNSVMHRAFEMPLYSKTWNKLEQIFVDIYQQYTRAEFAKLRDFFITLRTYYKEQAELDIIQGKNKTKNAYEAEKANHGKKRRARK